MDEAVVLLKSASCPASKAVAGPSCFQLACEACGLCTLGFWNKAPVLACAQILADGVDLRELDAAWFRSQLGVVSQAR